MTSCPVRSSMAIVTSAPSMTAKDSGIGPRIRWMVSARRYICSSHDGQLSMISLSCSGSTSCLDATGGSIAASSRASSMVVRSNLGRLARTPGRNGTTTRAGSRFGSEDCSALAFCRARSCISLDHASSVVGSFQSMSRYSAITGGDRAFGTGRRLPRAASPPLSDPAPAPSSGAADGQRGPPTPSGLSIRGGSEDGVRGFPVSEPEQWAGSSVVRMHREARVSRAWSGSGEQVGLAGLAVGPFVQVRNLVGCLASRFVFLDALSSRGGVDESGTVSDAHRQRLGDRGSAGRFAPRWRATRGQGLRRAPLRQGCRRAVRSSGRP